MYVYIHVHTYTYVYIRIHTPTPYTKEYHSAIKKEEILPFVTTSMNLEDMMLNEIIQTEGQIPHGFTYMWNAE